MANVYEPTDAVGQVDIVYGLNISSLLPSLHECQHQLRGLAEEAVSVLDLRGRSCMALS